VEGAAVVTGLTCLTAPTPTLRMPLQERGFWRLISHLSLGHLSVVGGETAADALREVLRLYDCRDTSESRAAIRALLSVTSRPGTARIPGLRGPGARTGGFCRGLDVTLTFDEQVWTTGGLYVLASVLDRFLALHATVAAPKPPPVGPRGPVAKYCCDHGPPLRSTPRHPDGPAGGRAAALYL
jgi:type VI secretion system protein ImpG